MRRNILVVIGLVACGPSKKSTPPGEVELAVQSATYGNNAQVSAAVVNKCKFEQVLAQKTAEAIPKAGVGTKGPTKTLALEIVRMKGADPSWQGDISVIVRGTLADAGEPVGTFRLRRSAVGGVVGGMRGVCMGLEEVAETMGEDISAWVKTPSMDADLN